MLDEFLNKTLLYQRRKIDLIHKGHWQKTTHFTSLSSATVDIWCARSDLLSTPIKPLTELLSREEKERSEQFRFEKDKWRRVFSRATLRLILSKYLDESPAQIQIISGPHGKPILPQRGEADPLHFNVSHSDEIFMYAMTRVGPIGVDVEKVREIVDVEKMIEQFFSPHEKAAFHQLPPTQKMQAFFTCWSRKEAFIKARGSGLSLPLNQFDVSILPDEPALINTSWNPLEVNDWLLSDLWLDVNYAAALAVDISRMKF